MNSLIVFQLEGRVGHFLRAETGVSALSYPLPPRTALLGMIGAILGLEKDYPQVLLEPMSVAVAGKQPLTHWHRAKLRKDPPEALPREVKSTQTAGRSTKEETATLILQEWLFNPCFKVWVALPEPYHTQLESRIREGRWFFQPSLGLSEMMADIKYLATTPVTKLPPGNHQVATVVNEEHARIDYPRVFEQELAIHILRMPRTVTAERVFTHARYFMERDGKAFTVTTDAAYKADETVLMFL